MLRLEMFLKIGVFGLGFKVLPGYEDDAEKSGYFASHWYEQPKASLKFHNFRIRVAYLVLCQRTREPSYSRE